MNTPRWITTYILPDSWMTREQRRRHWILFVCWLVVLLSVVFRAVAQIILLSLQ